MFERGQDAPRPRDYGGGETSQPRDLDPVAAIGSAGQNLVEEDDVVFPFARGDVRNLEPLFAQTGGAGAWISILLVLQIVP